MTRNDDIERVLEQWFTEGPRDMSDRLFDGTLERIERLPRRRLADLQLRLSAMTLNARLLAAAAVLVALFGAGLVVLNGMPGVGARSSPTPPAPVPSAPVPSAARSALPTELQSVWVSAGDRLWPGTERLPSSVNIRIDPNGLSISDFKGDVPSWAWLLGPGIVEVELGGYDTTPPDCLAGDVGSYAYVLGADHASLSLTALTDACQSRRAILEGDWRHTDIGFLAPGKHQSAIFMPYYPQPGIKVSYAVPAGWAELVESETQLSLIRDVGASFAPAIDVLADVSPYHEEGVGPPASNGPAASCDVSGSDVVGTPAAVADWLASLPALVVSKPAPVSIGGLDGVIVDLAVAPGWINTCSVNGARDGTVGVVYDTPAYTFAGPGSNPALGITGDERARYVLLDRGSGTSLVIAISATAATWDATMAAAMPIIESLEFAP